MARIFITGSSDGLGFLAAQMLIAGGHRVVIHARNAERANQTLNKIKGAENILIADLSDMEETKNLAAEVNTLGNFDAVIHNAGIYRAENKLVFAVNSLAPYILTCLINRPQRLIYLSSGLHSQGNPHLDNVNFNAGKYNYSDTKLQIVMLAKAVARKWPEVYSNAVNPGWVPTKMGGANAPDDLQQGAETQVWLAVSNDKEALVSGKYFFHKRERPSHPMADRVTAQEEFLLLCEKITEITFNS